MVLDRTPFYAESGGRADTGTLDAADGNAHVCRGESALGKMTLHAVRGHRGVFACRQRGHGSDRYGETQRDGKSSYGTHLLQAALQDILGDHVHQAGSLVTPERLRFDFTHFEPSAAERLLDIERQVNASIRTCTPVSINFMPIAEARQAGAMALFGEKYEDVVRVVAWRDQHGVVRWCHVKQNRSDRLLQDPERIVDCRRRASHRGRVRRALRGRASRAGSATDAHGVAAQRQRDDLEARVHALIEENKRLSREVTKWNRPPLRAPRSIT